MTRISSPATGLSLPLMLAKEGSVPTSEGEHRVSISGQVHRFQVTDSLIPCFQVWLHSGSFHIVPMPRIPGDPRLPAQLGLRQALQLVRGRDVETRAGQKVQDAISQRLAGERALVCSQAVCWLLD